MGWEAYLPLIFCWALALAAVTSLGFAFWSLRWPSIMGTVEVSILEPELKGDRVTESFSLAYAYEVAGVKYLGSYIKPWGDYSWTLGYGGDADGFYSGQTFWSRARDLSKWYRPEAPVKVYYCPLRHAWTCLEPGGFIVPSLTGIAAALIYFFFVR